MNELINYIPTINYLPTTKKLVLAKADKLIYEKAYVSFAVSHSSSI